MEFKDILAISGMPGLFRFVAQAKNGIIVESFSDKKRMHVSAHQKVSSMDDISVFTNEGEAKLSEVFRKIREMEEGKECLDPKSEKTVLLDYFGKVLPDFDASRVYPSDIKKILQWYNILLKEDLLSILDEQEEKKEEKEPAEDKEKKTGAASSKSTSKKKNPSATPGGAAKGMKESSHSATGAKRIPGSTKNK